MGLFDTVRCEYPLPNPEHQHLEFQTKSLDPCMLHYTITRDGRLIRHARYRSLAAEEARLDRDVECPMHGDIEIYASVEGTRPQQYEWIEYTVRFTHGRVECLRQLHRPPAEPKFEPLAAPSSPPTTSASKEDELELLLAIRRERDGLHALLQRCSDHWGYEDPIYRFYHQSFKVYELQQTTRTIVDRLQALLPGRPLNAWFVKIVDDGLGKSFDPEHNKRWPEETRPILEAFFHARFFLEMAVRYSDLDTPATTLPSGYAALLYLFNRR